MSKKRWFVLRLLATVTLVALLAAGGYALYRMAWAQGYAAGQVAETGEELAFAHPFPGQIGFYPRFFPFLGCLRPLLILGALFLFFGLVSKLIRFMFWGRAAWGPMGMMHARHWRRTHGPMPPWWCGEPPAEEAEADSSQ